MVKTIRVENPPFFVGSARCLQRDSFAFWCETRRDDLAESQAGNAIYYPVAYVKVPNEEAVTAECSGEAENGVEGSTKYITKKYYPDSEYIIKATTCTFCDESKRKIVRAQPGSVYYSDDPLRPLDSFISWRLDPALRYFDICRLEGGQDKTVVRVYVLNTPIAFQTIGEIKEGRYRNGNKFLRRTIEMYEKMHPEFVLLAKKYCEKKGTTIETAQPLLDNVICASSVGNVKRGHRKNCIIFPTTRSVVFDCSTGRVVIATPPALKALPQLVRLMRT